ncbi:MAG: hypothetical protein IJA86_03095 [Clostridia bacterium]|nr:hypothetical protein [Clostridia bacterium]
MVVTFCGHSQFQKSKEYEKKILAFLEEKVGNQLTDMYFGGYGNFDCFVYDCCKKYKETHPNISLVFVTPYLMVDNQCDQEKKYDSILYPGFEDKPKRYAIIYRNKYMIEKADYVIAYISHDWGGAYTTYRYAKRKGKEIFNLIKFEE